MAEKVNSGDIRAALKLRFEPGSHALLFEVANSTGAGARRYADAVALGLWPSHGHKVEGIEIKVSRSDFLSEMKDPSKSQEVFQYCDHFWLACPKGMVQPSEVPSTWGLLEYQANGTLRATTKAPRLSPIPMPIGFVAALLRRHAGHDEEMSRSVIKRQVHEATERLRSEFESERRNRHGVRVEAAERGMALLERIKADTGLDLTEFGADDLLDAIKVAKALNHGWSAPLQSLRKSAEDVIRCIDRSGYAKQGEVAHG